MHKLTKHTEKVKHVSLYTCKTILYCTPGITFLAYLWDNVFMEFQIQGINFLFLSSFCAAIFKNIIRKEKNTPAQGNSTNFPRYWKALC